MGIEKASEEQSDATTPRGCLPVLIISILVSTETRKSLGLVGVRTHIREDVQRAEHPQKE